MSQVEFGLWRTRTGSGDNVGICQNIVKTSLSVKLYTYSLHRQWPTTTSAVKSNYFRFVIFTLNFVHNELAHTYIPSE